LTFTAASAAAVMANATPAAQTPWSCRQQQYNKALWITPVHCILSHNSTKRLGPRLYEQQQHHPSHVR
jgi:hypothetical protein